MTKPIVNASDVPLREITHGDGFAAKLGRIGPLIGAKKLGCQLHIVPPGKKAFPRHAHHSNEEMFIILNGDGEYRAGEDRYAIRTGDIIAAPAGDAATAHQILNTSNNDLRYLAVSTRLDPDVVEYPDSGKFSVASMIPEDTGLRGARVFYVGRTTDAVDYWDGEV